jgi:membrane associated rhomboid family serine protease
VVLGLTGVLIAAHAARPWMGDLAGRLALSRGDLEQGRYLGLVGHMFVHGGWPHVLFNSVFILAFGAPVAKFFGESVRGGAVFLAFFLFCGVLAALGFVAAADLTTWVTGTDPGDWTLVGASGAASGLMGGAVRLMAGQQAGAAQREGRGGLGGLTNRTVISASLGWIAINVILGLTGLTPGSGGAPVAWQAHIAGYFVGLFTVGMFRALSHNTAIEP